MVKKDKNKQMHIIAQLSSGQGLGQGGWRQPGKDNRYWLKL